MSTPSIETWTYPILNHSRLFRSAVGGYWTLVTGKMWPYWIRTSWIPCPLFRISKWEDYTWEDRSK